MGFSGSDCGQACFDNRDSAELIRLIFWIMAIIKGIFAFMDNGSPKKKSSVTRLSPQAYLQTLSSPPEHLLAPSLKRHHSHC
ncbi:TPA: hypothetical protein MIR57_00365 [Klebsiella pneumoniae]|uniref:Uncharacterized protein n=1 Tax=Klebsiella pneumoniae TaxID=573 RepID=A0A483ME88_KLEPN|nr:hypothetical protein D9K64_08430 [Klebsiella pneumoniae]ROE95786.1 hypothetical protein C4Y83_026260 [Klebsiella pneumoniae subsp. pneumoniae]KSW89620.1 hypothetical protein APT74_28410 [Klebsiella pneumoniae]MDN6919938.1 hypothetical protein [Klebsiella pneumoniae]OYK00840.1 hypothetical protein CI660_14245 [Klebsiella pneumoniae]